MKISKKLSMGAVGEGGRWGQNQSCLDSSETFGWRLKWMNEWKVVKIISPPKHTHSLPARQLPKVQPIGVEDVLCFGGNCASFGHNFWISHHRTILSVDARLLESLQEPVKLLRHWKPFRRLRIHLAPTYISATTASTLKLRSQNNSSRNSLRTPQ